MKVRRRSAERGHAVLEVALMLPWIVFLFVGAFDFGFYAYSVISVENAARIAALHVASSPGVAADANAAQFARTYVCGELRYLVNVGSACPDTVVKVSVPAQPFTGADGDPATQVTITYTTVPLIPMPGLHAGPQGKWTFSRTVQARL